MISYCTSCLLPSTKPDLNFDVAGKCAACVAYDGRVDVDWKSRKIEFQNIVDRFRTKSSGQWDCIVPVSGGKDSTAQVLKVLELGMRPLCVTSTTCDLSDVGRKNIENIKNLVQNYVSQMCI